MNFKLPLVVRLFCFCLFNALFKNISFFSQYHVKLSQGLSMYHASIKRNCS